MIDAISLTEEELTVLFAPTLHGENHSTLDHRQLRIEAASMKLPSSNARPCKQRKKKTKASTIKTSIHVVPARCGYRTGKCQNLQAIKRNGKLHKLCEFHRERANLNQKKLDRKKRMQRFKRPSTECVKFEDNVKASTDRADRSPRTVEALETSDLFFFFKEEAELNTELFLPTSLDEAPVALGCEELAIFCSLMTFDTNYRSRDWPSLGTTPCHYYTGVV